MTSPCLAEQIELHRDSMWRREEDLRVECAVDYEVTQVKESTVFGGGHAGVLFQNSTKMTLVKKARRGSLVGDLRHDPNVL